MKQFFTCISALPLVCFCLAAMQITETKCLFIFLLCCIWSVKITHSFILIPKMNRQEAKHDPSTSYSINVLETSQKAQRIDAAMAASVHATAHAMEELESDLSRMKRIRGPSNLGRPHITLYDKNLSPLGHCLCDTGASVSMLISNKKFEILRGKGMVNYVYKYSDEEAHERQLNTYSSGPAQPYIDSLAGITFYLIVEEQDNPENNRIQAVTVNCGVVYNSAKPDFLIGTIFIAAKYIVPLVIRDGVTDTCSTLIRTNGITSDRLHHSASQFLATGRAQLRLWTHDAFGSRNPIIERVVETIQNTAKRQKTRFSLQEETIPSTVQAEPSSPDWSISDEGRAPSEPSSPNWSISDDGKAPSEPSSPNGASVMTANRHRNRRVQIGASVTTATCFRNLQARIGALVTTPAMRPAK